MKVEYKRKSDSQWIGLINETKQASLGTYNTTGYEQDIYTSELTVPNEAIGLRFSYILDYGVKPQGTEENIVSPGDMEIAYFPNRLFLNEGYQNLDITIFDSENKGMDGVSVTISGCGINNIAGITNSLGRVSFSINPTYTRNDSLEGWITIDAKSSKHNYKDEHINLRCIDRLPPNILGSSLPEIGAGYAIFSWRTDVPSYGEVFIPEKGIISGLQEVKSQTVTAKNLDLGKNYNFTIRAKTKHSNNAEIFGSFTTRAYNNPPKIIILSPATGTTYKATCTVIYYVEDKDPTNGKTDRMDVYVLYRKVGDQWKGEIASSTSVYTGTYSFIWKTDDVGSGTF